MKKKKTKAPNTISGQFAPRLIEMLRSPAYRALSLSARRILDRIEIELANHGGRDNGKLPVTYQNLKDFGISNRDDIARGNRELCALGFIERTRGHAGNGEFRRPNLYRLTYLPAFGKKPTHEWRQIKALNKAAKIAKKFKRTNENKNRKPVTDSGTRSSRKTGRYPVTDSGTMPPNHRSRIPGRLSRQSSHLGTGRSGQRSPPPTSRLRRAAADPAGDEPMTFHRTNHKGGHHDEGD